MKKNKLRNLRKNIKKASHAGLKAALLMAALEVGMGIYYVCPEVLDAGISVIGVSLLALVMEVIFIYLTGGQDIFTDYDKEIIGKAFSRGKKKQLFTEGFGFFRDDESEDALEYFRELNTFSLTDNEKGVLAFYTAICYNRLGYSTNAGQQAVIAAERNVQPAESLLMAARSFNLSANYHQAAECYEKLLVISEQRGIFPFLYNEMGKMYLSANDTKNSRTYFEKAVEKNLDPITAQGGLALVDLMDGREDEACERYRLALIARIGDTEGYKEYCAQICSANGYPENFFEEHLRERFHRK